MEKKFPRSSDSNLLQHHMEVHFKPDTAMNQSQDTFVCIICDERFVRNQAYRNSETMDTSHLSQRVYVQVVAQQARRDSSCKPFHLQAVSMYQQG